MLDEQGTCFEEQPCNVSARDQAAATVHAIFGAPAALPPDVPKPVWGVWQEYARQQQAFDYIDQQPAATSKHLRVYSQEYGAKGQRNYIVSSPDKLWEMYNKLDPSHRHLYEIIREGQPCHLYFDLEYDLAANPHVDGDAQVMLLVLELVRLMKDRLGVTVIPERDVVELDSTTPVKFSRHVIIQLRRAWAHVGHVHAFVRLLLEQLHNKRQQEATRAAAAVSSAAAAGSGVPVASVTAADPAVQEDGMCSVSFASDAARQALWASQAGGAAAAQCGLSQCVGAATAALHVSQESGAKYAHFWVHKQSQQQEVTTLIDTAVYTRNRAFRLYLSSKFGKTQQLCATRRFLVGRLLAASKDVMSRAVQPANAAAMPAAHSKAAAAADGSASTLRPQQGAGRVHQADQCNTMSPKPKKKLRTAQDGHQKPKASSMPSLFTLIANASGTSNSSQPLTVGIPPDQPQIALPQQQPTAGRLYQHGRTVAGAGHETAATAVGQAPATIAQSYGTGELQQHSTVYTSTTCEGRTHSMYSTTNTACARGLLLSRGEESCISQQVLWASLVTHTAKCEGIKLLTMFKEDEAQQHTGVVRLPGQAPPLKPQQLTTSHADIKHVSRSMTPGPTPWPSLNTFVERICAQNGQTGSVGGWSVTTEPHTEMRSTLPSLLLSIRGNRWCENIQRQHRSNGIFFTVSIQEGVWVQGCCDPDCRGFRSPTLPLPQDVWEQLQHHFAGQTAAAAAVTTECGHHLTDISNCSDWHEKGTRAGQCIVPH